MKKSGVKGQNTGSNCEIAAARHATPGHVSQISRMQHAHASIAHNPNNKKCRAVVRVARVWARAAPSATARFCATTSRASRCVAAEAAEGAGCPARSCTHSGQRRTRCRVRERLRALHPCPFPPSYPTPHPCCAEARDPPPGAPWRCQAHLGPHLRGDARRPQGVPRERRARRRDVHGACSPQDGDCAGRRLRAQAPGPHALRLRRLNSRPSLRAASTSQKSTTGVLNTTSRIY